MFIPRSLRIKPAAKPAPSKPPSSTSTPSIPSASSTSTPAPSASSPSVSSPSIPSTSSSSTSTISPPAFVNVSLPSVNPTPDINTAPPPPPPRSVTKNEPLLSLLSDYDDEQEEQEQKQETAQTDTKQEAQQSEEDSGEVVMFSSQQRFALGGEPICIVCNKFGEYICDETEKDVCSMECKQKHLEDFYASQPPQEMDPQLVKAEKGMIYKEVPDIESLSEQQVNDIRHEVQITIKGVAVPRPVLEFSHCGFPEKLLANIAANGYHTPTPIQMQTIPIALSERDMMACASTGSGKTACFVLPALYHVLAHTPNVPEHTPMVYSPKPLALILAPTRELCMQIEDQIKPLSQGLPIRTALVVGGLPMPNQVYRLKSSVQIVVATPGRLIDILVKHPEIDCLGNVNMVVLDEVDMMLQMGFETQVMQIVKAIGEHQTLLFSATIPASIEKMSQTILNEPVFVAVGSPSTPTSAVKQTVLWVENKFKKKKLFDLLEDPKYYHPPIVVFVDSKKGADMLAEAIQVKTGISTVSVHGDKTQMERTDVLRSFVNGEHPIIVSTAVLGRGLDLLRVDMVINFDMPPSVQEYIHQIGRAGRLGRSGWAVTFVNNENKSVFGDLVQMCDALKISVPKEILNSPYLKAEKKRKAQAGNSSKQKVEDPSGTDSWKKEQDRKRRK